MELLVNIDHVATLRNARGEGVPDPVEAAAIAEDSGAAGIVFHLREDRRHILDDDVYRLKSRVRGVLDFEMAATDEMLRICTDVKPHLATLVPESRQERTTEGGLPMERVFADYRDRVVPHLKAAGVALSLFIDPNPRDVELAHKLGVEAIELHTGTYAQARGEDAIHHELNRLREAAVLAHQAGLLVNAGHGLDFANIRPFIADVPYLHDVSIGHALVTHALFHGWANSVRRMADILTKGS
jgi:pyridoxine 5-phosphate synthase